MPNTKSAKKMVLKNERNRKNRRSISSRVKTFMDKAKKSINDKDLAASQINFRNAQSQIMKAKTKGIYHKNKASRLVSCLNAKLKSLALSLAPLN